MSERITVVLAADRNFRIPIAVVLASLRAHHTPDEIRVVILADGFTDRDRRLVTQSAPELDCRWLAVNEMAALDGARVEQRRYTKATLARLLIAELLPEEERVVYLDGDVVVETNLLGLAETDLGSGILGAVRADDPWVGCAEGWPRTLLSPSLPYFNAGVLLIPVDRWREEGVGRQALALLKQYSLRWNDQDALNIVSAERWSELPRRYNVQPGFARAYSAAWALWPDDAAEAAENPAVVHFSGAKPWKPPPDHPMWRRWYHYLDGTSFAGWRPSRMRIVARSMSRALAELRDASTARDVVQPDASDSVAAVLGRVPKSGRLST